MWCLVNLPNGTTFGVQCDPKGIGQECLEKVCQDLNIVCETDYFGLINGSSSTNDVDSKTKQWLNLRNPLFRHGNERGPFHLALRVKFWVPTHLILQDSVRTIFYMQARSDLLENRLMTSDWENSAKLGALLVQGDDIKFNPACLTEKCPTIPASSNAMNSTAITTTSSSKSMKLKPERRRSSNKMILKSSDSIENINNTTTTAAQDMNLPQLSPLRLYENYIIRPEIDGDQMPENFLMMIAREHEKLAKMPAQSAKYWLLKEISKLGGFGEEIFSGVSTGGDQSVACDIGVGPHGLVVYTENEKRAIPFSAIEQAKSLRRTFRLNYFDEEHVNTTLEVKLSDHRTAAGLYRAITEKHAFYSCETVRSAVTTQFTRDLKGTIASMFNEDTELGKRYVFDIQRTCREVHDNARRTLHARGIEIRPQHINAMDTSEMETEMCGGGSLGGDLMSRRYSDDKENEIERVVNGRIAEAWTCRICMDSVINTMFSPCGHVMSCASCAEKCERCPLCRAPIDAANKIFLPTELRVGPTTDVCV